MLTKYTIEGMMIRCGWQISSEDSEKDVIHYAKPNDVGFIAASTPTYINLQCTWGDNLECLSYVYKYKTAGRFFGRTGWRYKNMVGMWEPICNEDLSKTAERMLVAMKIMAEIDKIKAEGF
jgi:hypothetical protein